MAVDKKKIVKIVVITFVVLIVVTLLIVLIILKMKSVKAEISCKETGDCALSNYEAAMKLLSLNEIMKSHINMAVEGIESLTQPLHTLASQSIVCISKHLFNVKTPTENAVSKYEATLAILELQETIEKLFEETYSKPNNEMYTKTSIIIPTNLITITQEAGCENYI